MLKNSLLCLACAGLMITGSSALAQDHGQQVGKPLDLGAIHMELVYRSGFSGAAMIEFENSFIEEGKRTRVPNPKAEWIAEGWGGAEICDGKLWVAPVPFENCGQRVTDHDKDPSHMVVWNKNRFPADMLFEFTVNHQGSDNGLTLVFFAAEGLQGEDVFSLDLPPRNGVYRNYNKGQLKNYTVSYWSRNKKPSLVERGEQYTNRMRKNPGANKLSTEYSRTDKCNDCDYRVRVLKLGGHLAVEINGVVVNQVTDPEPLGGGYIGLRNMMGVDAVSYDNFIVYSVGKSVAKAGRNDLAAETGGRVDFFANNGYSNTVGTMQHPSGEYYEGVTYVAYQGPLEDPYVAAYEHATGTWTGPFKAGDSIMGKTPGEKIDNHGKPALVVDGEGYIHLVFGGHGGLPSHGINELGNAHKGKMIHVVTKRPQDISEWEVLDNIPPFGTYNQFVKMDNGDIYLFYRHGAHKSNWVYQLSTDNGRSFGPRVSILKHQLNVGDPGMHDSWYAWFTNGRANEIIGVYNYHRCRETNHIGERHNGYYMAMDTTDQAWRNVEGERLTMPVTKDHADQKTLVVDTGDLWTVRGVTALDPAGKPHATFEVGEGMGLHHGGPKQTRHYRWTGQEWVSGGSTALPESSVGNMRVSSPQEVSLLLGGDEVAWWHSTDGGKSFAKGATLIKHDKTRFSLTSMVRNSHPDARVIAAGNNRSDKNIFREMYLLGERGPVKRAAASANQLSQ